MDIALPPGAEIPPGSEVTLKDIARLAGVSVATASRVVNRTGLVATAKREAVENVLKQFSYIPNNAARALIKRRTKTVGLIVPTLAIPVFAPTIAAIEETLLRAGFGLLIASSHRDVEKELAHARTMIERGVDGIILTGSYRHPDVLPLTAARGVALVIQDDPVGTDGAVSIAMQDAGGMGRAIDELVANGHRRIAVVTGPTDHTKTIEERVRGARERLVFHGIAVADQDVEETPDYEVASARLATARLLGRGAGYTAFACTGDILALGVITELRRAGLTVPDEVSVIGCGNTMMAQFADPPLTTINMPFDEMGAEAATQLLHMIEHRKPQRLRPLEFRLVPGKTVARAAGQPAPQLTR